MDAAEEILERLKNNTKSGWAQRIVFTGDRRCSLHHPNRVVIVILWMSGPGGRLVKVNAPSCLIGLRYWEKKSLPPTKFVGP